MKLVSTIGTGDPGDSHSHSHFFKHLQIFSTISTLSTNFGGENRSRKNVLEKKKLFSVPIFVYSYEEPIKKKGLQNTKTTFALGNLAYLFAT